MKNLLKVINAIIIIISLYLIIDIGRYMFYPNLESLKDGHLEKTSFMLFKIKEAEKNNKIIEIENKWVSLDEISPYIIKGVLISEDDKFWIHNGFDIESLEYAIKENIEKGEFASGGSTITQQLAKNLFLEPNKNPIRKLKESILSYRLENTLSKERILELYLNSAEWGEGIFGIESASQHYYNKSAFKLTAKESSKLIAVLPNPILFNPLSNNKIVKKRSEIIFNTLEKRGIISKYDEIMKKRNSKIEEKNIETLENLEDTNIMNNLETKVNNLFEPKENRFFDNVNTEEIKFGDEENLEETAN